MSKVTDTGEKMIVSDIQIRATVDGALDDTQGVKCSGGKGEGGERVVLEGFRDGRRVSIRM